MECTFTFVQQRTLSIHTIHTTTHSSYLTNRLLCRIFFFFNCKYHLHYPVHKINTFLLIANLPLVARRSSRSMQRFQTFQAQQDISHVITS